VGIGLADRREGIDPVDHGVQPALCDHRRQLPQPLLAVTIDLQDDLVPVPARLPGLSHVRDAEVQRHETPARGQHMRRLRIGQRAHRVEYHVKRAAQRLGRGGAIVDETVRAKCRHKLRPFPRGDARHFSAQRVRDLHRVGPDTARGADDQHLLARLHTREPVEELQRAQCTEGQRRRLDIAEDFGRFQDRSIGLHHGVFRMRPAELEPENPVAHGELRHALANLGDGAGEIAAQHALARPEDAEHQPPRHRADQPRKRRGAQTPVRCRDAGGPDPHEDLALARHGAGDLFHLHHLGPAVLLVNRRFHLDLHPLSHSIGPIYPCTLPL